MNNQKIQIFDTTLRDGTQGERISFSVEDKISITKRLDEFGIDYIEGGWPMSNPKDFLYFQKIKQQPLTHAKIVAFGSTMRRGKSAADDLNLQKLIEAETSAVSIFGKSWLLHVDKALMVSHDENLELIFNSVKFLKEHGREVIYDAEHFFDGFKDNSEYALKTLKAAQSGGADTIALCDTNGGTLPSDLVKIIDQVKGQIFVPLGIHAHNDSELAVANSIAAVENGCQQVQGTINGYGERCGNANLCSIISNLQLKRKYLCVPATNLTKLTALSHYVSEIANVSHPHFLPFVGKSAFAHKGGIHVSAVMRDAATYEHIPPEKVGNRRRVLVSDLSGKSNIFYKAKELKIDMEENRENVPEIVHELKNLENNGYQFEAADGSFELLVRKIKKEWNDFFRLQGFRILIEKNESEQPRSETTIRLLVNGKTEHTAAEGNGPVHALDKALRKALTKFYPEINDVYLSDYKVRVLNEKDGTGAKVRVLIESKSSGKSWGTVGVSENIIEASWQALMDSFSYYLLKIRSSARKPESLEQVVMEHR